MREGFMEVVTLEPGLNQTQHGGHSRKRKEHRQRSQGIEEASSFPRLQTIQRD